MSVYWYLNTIVVILTKVDVSRIINLTMDIDSVMGVWDDGMSYIARWHYKNRAKITQYVILSTANSNGKNTLENLSMFMALVRFLCARAVVAAKAAAVACGGGRGGGGIGWPSFNFKLLCKPKHIFHEII